jgi:hypothetical protein
MSSVEGYLPGVLSVVIESDSSFSKSFAMRIRLDRNIPLFNPYLDSIHNKSISNARDLTHFCLRFVLGLFGELSGVTMLPHLSLAAGRGMQTNH